MFLLDIFFVVVVVIVCPFLALLSYSLILFFFNFDSFSRFTFTILLSLTHRQNSIYKVCYVAAVTLTSQPISHQRTDFCCIYDNQFRWFTHSQILQNVNNFISIMQNYFQTLEEWEKKIISKTIKNLTETWQSIF